MWNHAAHPGWAGFDGAGPWMAGHGGLTGFLLFALLTVVAIALTRYLWRAGTGGGGAESPLAVLETRYAEGGMDRADFVQRRRDLTMRRRHWKGAAGNEREPSPD